MIVIWVLLGILAILIIGFVVLYNSLVRLRNQVKNSFAQIDVQLKRRSDLIPNLVETVKGYMKHEKETLENITKARSAVMGAQTVKDKAKANNMLTDTLKSLFAVSENYPDLKANQNFMQLQEEITGTENKISYSRQHYNDMVMVFNTKIQSFPNNLLVGIFGFKEEESFEATAEERKNVKVQF
jgi:LemA protein